MRYPGLQAGPVRCNSDPHDSQCDSYELHKVDYLEEEVEFDTKWNNAKKSGFTISITSVVF